MIVKQLIVGQLQTNCYIAACEETKEGVVIDPGGDASRIFSEVEALGLTITLILNTHAHFDHVGANEALKTHYNAPVGLHPLDIPLLQAQGGAAVFGLEAAQCPDPDFELTEDETIQFGTNVLKILHTPGHTPGHVSFYEEREHILFDGDVLFDGGIGRTDIPGGDTNAIFHSITDVLFKLPDNTVVYSGHGNPTTIGKEKSTNPWIGLE